MRPAGLLSDHAPAEIPASHRDLAQCPLVAALTTVTRDGYPQTSVVWCDFDGQCLRVNTMRGFAKERNMRRNRRVTLLCYDPRQPLRYLEVRGIRVGGHLGGSVRCRRPALVTACDSAPSATPRGSLSMRCRLMEGSPG